MSPPGNSLKKSAPSTDIAPGTELAAHKPAVVPLGIDSEAFQVSALTQAFETLWQPESKSEETKQLELQAIYDTMQNIAPRNALEGMLALQMVGVHNAAMECMRRAMIDGQSFEGRDQNLKHAAKLMGLYERQLSALDRHRGKGQQKITVEHVTVEAGGQAIVGDVSLAAEANVAELGPPPGGSQAMPHARQAKTRAAPHRKSGQ